jgi:hypothetical protein
MAAEDSVRKAVRSHEEAAMAIAFEESHRLLDRIEGLKDSVPASLAGVTGKFVEEAQANRAAIHEYAEAVKQDMTDSGESLKAAAESLKAGLLSAAEGLGATAAETRAAIEKFATIASKSVQQTGERVVDLARDEAARIAHEEAARAFADVSRLKMQELETAVNNAAHRFGTIDEKYAALVANTDQLARRVANQQVSAPRGGSWTHTIVGAVLAAVIILGGQVVLSHQSFAQLSAQVSYLIQRSNGAPAGAEAAGSAPWGQALMQEWRNLPPDVQRRITNAHARLTQQ